jgi:uncharacterized oxidoreductase
MHITGNTILITGGGSGIGRGLAEQLLAHGNQVIIAGRRKQVLEETVHANPGMHSIAFDVESPESIRAFATEIIGKYPALNILVNNAGIMRPENLLAQQSDLADAEATINTNLLGPIRLTAAFLPHLQAQAASTIINVTSGLAYVPLALTPTYCATKAAIHSYTESLRYQLRKTSVEVIELAPPYVQTHLMSGAEDPRAMPLNEFILEVMTLLKTLPTPKAIYVERVKQLSLAEAQGRYDATFEGMNAARSAESL